MLGHPASSGSTMTVWASKTPLDPACTRLPGGRAVPSPKLNDPGKQQARLSLSELLQQMLPLKPQHNSARMSDPCVRSAHTERRTQVEVGARRARQGQPATDGRVCGRDDVAGCGRAHVLHWPRGGAPGPARDAVAPAGPLQSWQQTMRAFSRSSMAAGPNQSREADIIARSCFSAEVRRSWYCRPALVGQMPRLLAASLSPQPNCACKQPKFHIFRQHAIQLRP